MFENIRQFEIPVHDFVLYQGLKPMKNLHKKLHCFFFGNVLLLLEVGSQIALIAEFQNQVNVINSLLDIDEANDVVISAGFEDLNFVIEELGEFALRIKNELPLTLSLLMVLIATSDPSTLL